MIQKNINYMIGMRISSKKVVDHLERNAGVPDIKDKLDTLQRSS